MTNIVDVLDVLAPNTWTGTGFNLIAVPNAGGGPPDPIFTLLLNATEETLRFSAVTPDAKDRGAGKHTVSLRTALYLQTIKDPKDNTTIHVEPGLWGHVPRTDENSDTFFRLASTPHGDCLLAQSTFFGPVTQELEIEHVSTNSFPFQQTDPIPKLNADPANPLDGHYIGQYLNPGPNFPADFLPKGLNPAEIVKDPAKILLAAIKGQAITETDVIVISTKPTQPTGILNIPVATSTAKAVQMDAIVWVEKLKDGGSGTPPYQLQYLQRVILDFGRVHWPHVSVATLKLDNKKTVAQLP
ncbi:MAG: heme-binding protein [Terriglobia bacterium]